MSVEDIASQSSVIFETLYAAGLKKIQFPGFMFMFPRQCKTLVRRGGITNHHLIAYLLSNICAKSYQNRLMCVEVIVCNISVIFRHSVYRPNPPLNCPMDTFGCRGDSGGLFHSIRGYGPSERNLIRRKPFKSPFVPTRVVRSLEWTLGVWVMISFWQPLWWQFIRPPGIVCRLTYILPVFFFFLSCSLSFFFLLSVFAA